MNYGLASFLVLCAMTTGQDELGPIDYFTGAHDGFIDLWGEAAQNSAGAGDAGSTDATPHMWRIRAPQCSWDAPGTAVALPCPGDPVVPLPECGDLTTVPPLWERTAPDAIPGPWVRIEPSRCAAATDVTPAMVLAEFRRLPLAPSPLVVQPDRGWVLVNKPTVVYAQPGPQTLATRILGTEVTITATPAAYAWDFGDGAALTTADPGRPWPAADLAHTYTRLGTYEIALTTTWAATYTVAGDRTVRVVPGTATTTGSTSLVVQERRAHLVAGPCAGDPAAPGC